MITNSTIINAWLVWNTLSILTMVTYFAKINARFDWFGYTFATLTNFSWLTIRIFGALRSIWNTFSILTVIIFYTKVYAWFHLAINNPYNESVEKYKFVRIFKHIKSFNLFFTKKYYIYFLTYLIYKLKYNTNIYFSEF